MSKFSGILGVRVGWETKNGLSTPIIKEHPISGDLLYNSYHNETGKEINDNVKITNRFSFIAPPEIVTLFSEASLTGKEMAMYITYFGMKLKVTEFTINPPRIVCTVGGVWNE